MPVTPKPSTASPRAHPYPSAQSTHRQRPSIEGATHIKVEKGVTLTYPTHSSRYYVCHSLPLSGEAVGNAPSTHTINVPSYQNTRQHISPNGQSHAFPFSAFEVPFSASNIAPHATNGPSSGSPPPPNAPNVPSPVSNNLPPASNISHKDSQLSSEHNPNVPLSSSNTPTSITNVPASTSEEAPEVPQTAANEQKALQVIPKAPYIQYTLPLEVQMPWPCLPKSLNQSRPQSRAIEPTKINWDLRSTSCPYINPVTAQHCGEKRVYDLKWPGTRHFGQHILQEVKWMAEGLLEVGGGTIIHNKESYENFKGCRLFCDRCRRLRSVPASSAEVLLALDIELKICDHCEEKLLAAYK